MIRAAVILAVAALMVPTSSGAVMGRIEVTALALVRTTNQTGRVGRADDTVDQKWRLNDRRGRPIGTLIIGCRWVTAGARLCAFEARFALGKITLAGASKSSFRGIVSVTGGTNRYRGARGQATFVVTDFDRMILSINLT